MGTFVNPLKVRTKAIWDKQQQFGKCFLRAGFVPTCSTKGGLLAFVLPVERVPPQPALNQQLSHALILPQGGVR